jgi:hypothetical protein
VQCIDDNGNPDTAETPDGRRNYGPPMAGQKLEIEMKLLKLRL